MTENRNSFKELGITETEAKIFEALVAKGFGTGSEIAKSLGIHKSIAYFVLDSLVQKGLASFAVINKKREYKPIEPEQLKLKIDERKKTFAKNIQTILLVASTVKKEKKKTNFKLFEGWDGMKTAFEDILSTKKGEAYFVFAVDVPEKTLPRFRRFIKKFHQKRSEKGINCKLLVSEKLRSTIGKDRKSEPHTFLRFVSAEHSMPMAANVYQNKVLLAIWSDPPLAITIENDEVSTSFKSFFELLWKTTKS